MKHFVASLILSGALVSAPALAADPPKEAAKASAPTCGKTIEECQKAVDALNKQMKELRAAVQGATQQRDNALRAQANSELQAYVQEQAVAH